MNIEAIVIGEQCKRLREHAGLSLEEINEIISMDIQDLVDFENGKFDSSYFGQQMMMSYLQQIHLVNSRNKNQFTKLIKLFCRSQELDFDSFLKTYFNSIVDDLPTDKLRALLSTYMWSTNVLRDQLQEFRERYDKVMERYGEAYTDYETYNEMFNLLTEVIIDNDLDKKIIKLIKKQKNIDQPNDNDPDDFIYEQESYDILIKKIKIKKSEVML